MNFFSFQCSGPSVLFYAIVCWFLMKSTIINNPHLMNISSATVWNYNSAEWMALMAGPKVLAVPGLPRWQSPFATFLLSSYKQSQYIAYTLPCSAAAIPAMGDFHSCSPYVLAFELWQHFRTPRSLDWLADIPVFLSKKGKGFYLLLILLLRICRLTHSGVDCLFDFYLTFNIL